MSFITSVILAVMMMSWATMASSGVRTGGSSSADDTRSLINLFKISSFCSFPGRTPKESSFPLLEDEEPR